jgi:hypothetical protein
MSVLVRVGFDIENKAAAQAIGYDTEDDGRAAISRRVVTAASAGIAPCLADEPR